MAPNQSSTQSFLVTLPDELATHYVDKNKELGAGGFAKVILAEHKATGEKVAIKVMNKHYLIQKDDLHRAYNEIYALKHLSHQNICQLYEVFECSDFIYLVIEYCPGGELFDYIVSKKRLEEKEARSVFRQIISAVAYIHKQGYAHRDLKPENMLLDINKKIKIIDFGLSAKPEKGLTSPLRTRAGSALYASPELISGEPYYGNETDVWSLGVVLYALLCGFLPFDHENTLELYKKIKKGEFEVPTWLSENSLSLLRAMLEVDSQKRIRVKEILKHDWVVSGHSGPVLWQPNFHHENNLNFKAVQLIAAYFKLSLADAEKKILMFKYNELTSFYYILSKIPDKKLLKLLSAWSHRENFLGEPHSLHNGHGSSRSYLKEMVSNKENNKINRGTAHRERASTCNDVNGIYRCKPVDPCFNRPLADKELDKKNYNTAENNNNRDSTNRNSAFLDKLKPRTSKSVDCKLNETSIDTVTEQHEPNFRERCSSTIERFWARGRVRSNTLDSVLPSIRNKSVLLKNVQKSRDNLDRIDEKSSDGCSSQTTNTRGEVRSPRHDVCGTNLHETKRFAASCIDSLDSMKETSLRSPEKQQKCRSLDTGAHLQVNERRGRTRSVRDLKQRLSGLFKFDFRTDGSQSNIDDGMPRTVKAIYHVENTTSLPPNQLKREMERVLSYLVETETLISYTNTEQYLFKCKAGLEKKTVFELEICQVPHMDKTFGIRRKRLKGDAWRYKELVEQILSMVKI